MEAKELLYDDDEEEEEEEVEVVVKQFQRVNQLQLLLRAERMSLEAKVW